MAFVKAGGDIVANAVAGGRQFDSDIAGLAGGGYVVTWSDGFRYNPDDEFDYNNLDVGARVFSPLGRALGADIQVNANLEDEQDNPGVTGTPDGGFVVAFEDGSDATVGAVFITTRGFSASGAPTSATDLRLDSYSVGSLASDPQPVQLSDGRLLVVHGLESGGAGLETRPPEASAERIFRLGFSSDGFEDVAVDLAEQGVAVLSGDRFVHVYEGRRIDGDGNVVLDGVIAQIRTADGVAIGEPVQVNTASGDMAQQSPAVATLSDGRFAIVWQATEADGTTDILARIYDADGASLQGPFVVNEVATGSQDRPDIAAVRGGGFVVVWEDGSGIGGDASGTGIKARTFDPNGVADGGEVLVNTRTDGSQIDAHVAGLKGGGFAVSWTDGGGVDGADIRTQAFAPASAATDCPIVSRAGTQDGSAPANEVLNGPAGANTFSVSVVARSGLDTIANFETRDVLVTDVALRDANGDGIVTFGAKGLQLDAGRPGNGTDLLKIAGIDGAEGLRFLGEACAGVFVYADAAVRPAGAIEGRLGADTISGDVAGTKADTFFVDTDLKIGLGADAMIHFGTEDRIVTTTKLSDGNNDGIIDFGANRLLDLPDGGGSIAINGRTVVALEFDGSYRQDGTDYFVYSQVGSATAGMDGLVSA